MPTNSLKRPQGLSLVEVLVGLSMTLVVLLAMAQAFQFASGEMQQGRASVEMTNRLLNAETILRSDLDRLTVNPVPFHLQAQQQSGYFMIVDGSATDSNVATDNPATAVNEAVTNFMIGDYDDIFAGTIRSNSGPFRGRVPQSAANGNLITGVDDSHLAEVIWFTIPNDANNDLVIDTSELSRLYRRQLIIKPNFTIPTSGSLQIVFNDQTDAIQGLRRFRSNFDLSVRLVQAPAGVFTIVPNTLASLSNTNNRFLEPITGQLPANFSGYRPSLQATVASDRRTNPADEIPNGQDIFLNDVAAFDIQVFDPNSEVLIAGSLGNIQDLARPSDIGFINLPITSNNPSSFFTEVINANNPSLNRPRLGAFVDLGKTRGATGVLGVELGNVPANTPALDPFEQFVDIIYDTSQSFSANDGLNDDGDIQNGVPVVDEGNDGIDNDGDGIIDELDEQESLPPYSVPLRGLQISTRLIERTTGQASQATIKHRFVPQ